MDTTVQLTSGLCCYCCSLSARPCCMRGDGCGLAVSLNSRAVCYNVYTRKSLLLKGVYIQSIEYINDDAVKVFGHWLQNQL